VVFPLVLIIVNESVISFDLYRLVWESSLIDNLLNFAGTPKGLLLLQQTGKMNECVAYMNERYNKKLQVLFELLFDCLCVRVFAVASATFISVRDQMVKIKRNAR